MSIPTAYLGVIVIWSTTPLAIQWGAEGGYLFAVTARMILGAALTAIAVTWLRMPFVWHRGVWPAYVVAGLSIYVAMTAVYWAAQYIPSGWIAVIFGLSPIVTGVLAHAYLGERALTPTKLVGMLLGVSGLGLIFGIGLQSSLISLLAMAAVLLSTVVHCASAVAIKRLQPPAPALVVTLAGLLLSLPLFLISAALAQVDPLPQLSHRGWSSIVYLALVGSAVGFPLYFYVLRQVSALRMSLITLVTPVSALLLGHTLNGETIAPAVWVGVALIGAGLISFEFDRSWFRPAPGAAR